jgi:PAS domain S-box-containing protein
VYTQVTKIPITEGGRVTKIMSIIRDITERRHIEDALRESEEKFRMLAEESPNVIFIMVGGRVVYTNQRGFEVLGYTREEFYSPDMNITTLVAPEYLEKTSQAFARYLEGQQVEPFEYALVTRSGKRIPAIVASRIVDYEGQKALMGVITDISARKATEEALRSSEEKYRTFVENFQGIAYRGALDGAPIFFEGDVERITGYTEEEFLTGKPRWEDIIHPDDRAGATRKSMLASASIGETDLEKEYRIVRKDGRPLWVHQSVKPVRDESGTPILVQGAIYDISDRKRVEEGRERERKAFRIIADSAALDEDSPGVCRRVLPELARLLGFEFGTLRLYDPEQQVLRLAASFGLTEDVISSRIQDQPIESSHHVAAHVARTRLPIFAPVVKVSDELRDFEKRTTEMNVQSLVSWPLIAANQDLLGVIHLFNGEPRDIPEDDRGFFQTIAGMLCVVLDRKRAEEALERSETKYRKRFEISPVPQWEEDLSGLREHLEALRAVGVGDFVSYFNEHPEEMEKCTQLSRVLEVNEAALGLFGVADLEEFDRLRVENVSALNREPYLTWLDRIVSGEPGGDLDIEVKVAPGTTARVHMKMSIAPGYERSLERILISIVNPGEDEE